ncbi:hypothetical protein UF64_19140 [Thalassospira sp. HJ]|uniref:DUF4139 domain-containing protein n=1 Tax=Thalassospira sp. HJ TaxID=1616823 RepID=UPI0005CF2418|nr:DUF4139 domain-containing protein [Thalassospira sp. HJ]KJE33808.1 hypothetical protein UF64_19140 [Thalassospira sp. HJ]
MSAALRNRFALAALLGSAVFFGQDIEAARAQSPSVGLSADNRTNLQLTVYPGNLSLITEQRDATIPEGQSTLRIDGLPRTIMNDSFLLGTAKDADLVWSSLRNRNNGSNALDDLLRDQIGKTVTIRRDDDLIEGTLVALTHVALVETDAGIERVALDQVIISELPDGFTTAPTLDADIATGAPLDHVSMAYLLGGIGWNTSYTAYYDRAENSLKLTAIAKVMNASGSDYDDASLRLVAGDPNRVQQPPMVKAARTEMMMSAVADVGASAASAPERASFENLHVYGPFNGLSMKDGDTVILPLLDPQVLPVKRRAIFTAASSVYNMEQRNGEKFVRPELEIDITNEGGKDARSPWPDGIVRIYAKTPAGDTGYLSEDMISLTPIGQDATLRLGRASDLNGTRDVVALDRKARANLPDAVSADLKWTIRNTSDRVETVTIREDIPVDWKVTAESHKHERDQPNQISWEIDVPANGDVTLTWSVASTR